MHWHYQKARNMFVLVFLGGAVSFQHPRQSDAAWGEYLLLGI